jgi:hypothetical protein
MTKVIEFKAAGRSEFWWEDPRMATYPMVLTDGRWNTSCHLHEISPGPPSGRAPLLLENATIDDWVAFARALQLMAKADDDAHGTH